jgi:hypothetical protein
MSKEGIEGRITTDAEFVRRTPISLCVRSVRSCAVCDNRRQPAASPTRSFRLRQPAASSTHCCAVLVPTRARSPLLSLVLAIATAAPDACSAAPCPKWDESVRSFWADRLVPHLAGIFPCGVVPSHLDSQPNTRKNGIDPSRPSSSHEPNTS